ncbi:MAG: hypothetical protein CMP34_00530 [Rickettsiales bacterium]|nr:hypothetical protein [Rickettsiales bacterium]|tara:strand:- start:293 stop:754 length:462 start_codon:yes stop_codon:yes gene_type:complete
MKNHKILQMKFSHSKVVYNLQLQNKSELGNNIWMSWEIDNIIKSSNKFCKVSMKNENLTGFCIFSITEDFLELYSIFVDPNYRNQGIAKNFLKSAKEYCKKNFLKKILLEVNEKNKFAISLYKKQNFFFFGKRKNYYLENGKFYDAWLMRLNV